MPRAKTTHDDVRYFRSAAAFRAWLERHHAKRLELWVGFHKKGTGRPSLTWPESVDAALCFGWIDGIRKRVDEDRYVIRFTPRKPRSKWSAVNLGRVQALIREGLMRPPGLAAWERRDAKPSGYTYERASAEFPIAYERDFKARRKAWAFFQSRPPGYRRSATAWVNGAAREETRRRRLTILIDASERGRPIPPLDRGQWRS